ncbi:MAG: type II toxin-antitoxin system VapC family toxin [Elusimicrobia bacterium]|nr:type II toxin-antitoxin system VapC family toxin [Elusimicrobiota bacterium]
MRRFVLDASVALSWCFEDQQTSFSEAVLTALKRDAAPVVPPLWTYEVLNVLVLALRKGIMDKAVVATLWNKASRAVAIVENAGDTAQKIIELSERHGLTAYDAAYLELALREGLPLATLDHELKKAARAAGVRLFAPEAG